MAIFVSYSRRDAAFVRQLHEGIVARGHQTWVDWEGIPPSADWMREIQRAIEAAEAVVFVLSPDSIASAVCAQELAHAVKHHKRLLPVVCREVEPAKTPPELARLNWIVFTGSAFEPALDMLLSAVQTDLEWVEAHTRLLVRAVEWDQRQRDSSLTLRGADLEQAERWLTDGPNKAPAPTELQTRYIIDSRRQATQRRYIQLGAGTIALVLIATFGTLAWLQRQESARQEATAAARRLAALAERVRDMPLDYSTDPSRLHTSAQLAGEALRRVDAVGERLVEADVAVRRALALLPERVLRLALPQPASDALAVGFGASGELVAASRSASVRWPAPVSAETAQHATYASAAKIRMSADGTALAVIEPSGRASVVEVRGVGKPALLGTVTVAGSISYAALNTAGSELLTSSQQFSQSAGWHNPVSQLWAVQSARERAVLPFITHPVFSPDGGHLVGLLDKALAVWRVERLRSGDARPERVLSEEAGEARAPLFSVDGKSLVVALGEDPARVQIWDTRTGSLVRTFAPPPESWPVAVGPDARHVAFATRAAADGTGRILLFDSANACVAAQVPLETADASAAFARDGTILAVAVDKGIDLLRISARCGDAAVAASVPGAQVIAFARDRHSLFVLAHAGTGGDARMSLQHIDLPDGRLAAPIDLGSASQARFSADGTLLALAGKHALRWIEVASGQMRGSVDVQGVDALAISANPGYLVAATERQLHAWQLDPLRALSIGTLADPIERRPDAIRVGRNGVVAITEARASRIGQALSLRTFPLPAMQPVTTQPVGRDRGGFAASVCAVSDDGALVAINAARSRITVREIGVGRDLGTVDAAGQGQPCAFSTDGRLLAVADQTIRVWDVGAQSEIARVDVAAKVRAVAFSPDARYVAAVLEDDTVALWPLRPRALIERLCARVPGDLTKDEWERFVGPEPQQALCGPPVKP